MEAIIQTGGCQYCVEKGRRVVVNFLDGKEGDTVEFAPLATFTKDTLKTAGSPEGKVVAKILKHFSGEKVLAATYKRRKGLHKKKGHRQRLTQIEIEGIYGT